MNSCIDDQLIFNKTTKWWKNNFFFQQTVPGRLEQHMQKNKTKAWDHYFTPHTNLTSNRPYAKYKSWSDKTSRRTHGRKPWWHWVRQRGLGHNTKCVSYNRKQNDKLDSAKMKIVYTQMTSLRKWEKTQIEKKICESCIWRRDCIQNI